MKYYAEAWNGPVSSSLQLRNEAVPFGRTVDPADLPFALHLRQPGERMDRAFLESFDVILCSGDNHRYLDLAERCANTRTKLVYIIEYTPQTRRQIIFLDPRASIFAKLYSLAWTHRQERRRRRAFRRCDGLQANGYPAMEVYRRVNANTILYLDNRITSALVATEAEIAAREAHIRSGKPIRILHSGRLEPLKGAQDLVPIARRLLERGVNFELDIFGTGSLAAGIRREIDATGLSSRVRLHDPVDFETGLVPFARTRADIFLSCHRQSDPSCTYLESMGCGLPIAGYANEMWKGLREASDAGWTVPLGDWKARADQLHDIALRREEIVDKAAKAVSFASAHLFEQEFQRRIDHLQALVA
ncbi:hypothetical protein GCM10017056_52460 [Seohaeicola zhoushanensis]|uniref:Glycosyl transferase family 1 domain-containing protein n=2 Tax=Seohaeicola zhoushanensis TaxID=1569283 RepID=A0A8J3H393_9RHOB|nr:hypothetical protein GCM10017056_52460 [Seohaeicola zhoushanensis]